MTIACYCVNESNENTERHFKTYDNKLININPKHCEFLFLPSPVVLIKVKLWGTPTLQCSSDPTLICRYRPVLQQIGLLQYFAMISIEDSIKNIRYCTFQAQLQQKVRKCCYQLRHVCLSVCLPAFCNSRTAERILKNVILGKFTKICRHIPNFCDDQVTQTDTLHKGLRALTGSGIPDYTSALSTTLECLVVTSSPRQTDRHHSHAHAKVTEPRQLWRHSCHSHMSRSCFDGANSFPWLLTLLKDRIHKLKMFSK
jgi:hypothetical protein